VEVNIIRIRLDLEMEVHLELVIDENLKRGMPPEELD
jgi:hypothetical protein